MRTQHKHAVVKIATRSIGLGLLLSFMGCMTASRKDQQSSIRDAQILSCFHLRLNNTLHSYGIDCKYLGVLSHYGSGAWPAVVGGVQELLGWELCGDYIPHEPQENQNPALDTSVGGICLEPGFSDTALAVCEINGKTISVISHEYWDSAQVERNLKRRGLPPLKDLLAPLDIRRGGVLSRGSYEVVDLPEPSTELSPKATNEMTR